MTRPGCTEFVLDSTFPGDQRARVVALGNFDGLHRGHRAVMRSAQDLARSLGVEAALATFDPSPRTFFAPNAPAERIMSPRQRAKTLAGLGVSSCFLIPFNLELSQMSDEDFVRHVLVDRAGVSGVAVGYDFRFGRNRTGDAERLIELGQDLGLPVQIVEPVNEGAEKVSSTRIRALLRDGQVAEAARLLDGVWIIDAIVQHGEKRGRTLGYPTANLYLHGVVSPAQGVYAVWARREGDVDWLAGVASYGRTPTTGERDPLLEVHLFDFDADLYDARLEVAFVEFLRGEEKFASLEAMVAQIDKDAQSARAILARSSVPAI